MRPRRWCRKQHDGDGSSTTLWPYTENGWWLTRFLFNKYARHGVSRVCDALHGAPRHTHTHTQPKQSHACVAKRTKPNQSTEPTECSERMWKSMWRKTYISSAGGAAAAAAIGERNITWARQQLDARCEPCADTAQAWESDKDSETPSSSFQQHPSICPVLVSFRNEKFVWLRAPNAHTTTNFYIYPVSTSFSAFFSSFAARYGNRVHLLFFFLLAPELIRLSLQFFWLRQFIYLQ